MIETQERVTQFDKGTPPELQAILEKLRQGFHGGYGRRVRIFLGDPDTGKDWNEENDVTGYIGRSNGPKPVLILLPNARSLGGGSISTAHIVKLIEIGTGLVLWQNPKYHSDFFEAESTTNANVTAQGYNAEVYRKDPTGKKPAEVYARCKSYRQAHRLAAFMNGRRHAK